jgi:hypothetical protein
MADSSPGERSRWRAELRPSTPPVPPPVALERIVEDARAAKPNDWIRECRIKLLADLLTELYGWSDADAATAARRCIEVRSQQLEN